MAIILSEGAILRSSFLSAASTYDCVRPKSLDGTWHQSHLPPSPTRPAADGQIGEEEARLTTSSPAVLTRIPQNTPQAFLS